MKWKVSISPIELSLLDEVYSAGIIILIIVKRYLHITLILKKTSRCFYKSLPDILSNTVPDR